MTSQFPRLCGTESGRGKTHCSNSSGELMPVSQVVQAHFSADGKLSYLSTVMRDMTEVKRAEAALAESEAKFRTIFADAPFAIAITTPEGHFVDVNPRVVEELGIPREELLGTIREDDPRFFLPVEPNLLRGMQSELVHDGESVHRQMEVMRPADGARRWILLSVTPIALGGKPHLLAMSLNVTDRVHLQEQLHQAQKMEAIGGLAGGVAHDFNNLLTVINGYGELLASQLSGDETLRGHVEQIRKAGERAAALTQQLLAFSRKQVAQPRPIDLNEIVLEVLGMLRRSMGDDIVIESRLSPGLDAVMADPAQLHQVLVNLAINARDAMPLGGQLVLETSNVELAAEQLGAHAEATPGRYVQLVVTDSGVGMDAETQKRIFEPFYTTKGRGHGTGLGLATVHGIVRQNGGWIWVYSEVGRGTTFKLFLPRIDAAAMPGQAQALAPDGDLRGAETVLLVEDQEAVRHLAARVLRSYGYHLLTAGHGQEALAAAAAYDGPIDLLITDVEMPGMSGSELAERLLAARAGLKVLYTSGYTEDVIVRRGVLKAGVSYLSKPFSPRVLAAKVRELLG